MKKLKIKLLNWLLTDKDVRKVALHEIIGDKEVKQVHITGNKEVTISDCYLLHSKISDNEIVDIRNNMIESSVISNCITFTKPVPNIK